jgi:hypothetical protein
MVSVRSHEEFLYEHRKDYWNYSCLIHKSRSLRKNNSELFLFCDERRNLMDTMEKPLRSVSPRINRLPSGIKLRGKVDIDNQDQSMTFTGKGTVNITPDRKVQNADAFTVEAKIKPTSLKRHQYLLDSHSPPVRIEINNDGTVIGSVHTEDGWESVDSCDRKIGTNETVLIRLIRDKDGMVTLEINDRHANQKQTNKNLKDTGGTGVTIGGDSSGTKNLLSGKVSGIRFRRGAISGVVVDGYSTRAETLAAQLSERLEFYGKLEVYVEPETVDSRFDEIKAILAATGVQDVSALATLTIDRPTTIAKNQVMVAPPKMTINQVVWSEIATALANAATNDAVAMTATLMANRNSKNVLMNMDRSKNSSHAASMLNGAVSGAQKMSETKSVPEDKSRPTNFMEQTTLPDRNIASKVLVANSSLSRIYKKRLMGEIIKPAHGVEITDPAIIQDLDSAQPDNWPVYTPPLFYLTSITTIPVDTSVIIAGVLDLTNQRLMIEPDVKKLYIIAEQVIGDVNASISWRRPGGSTSSRLDDPNKNGRSYSGVHTGSGSRNGLPGGDGLNGDPGFAGADGIDAPHLEVWVKNLTAMPDIDLNGEQGIKGGRGQRGGRGGNGAKGETGKWWWMFGVRCWEDPGHGGDGGDGGDGGRGGRGGNGGNAGNISIGVLKGTLASSVEARAFKIKNQGGLAGRGGNGGNGGYGGNGGPHGNDYKDGEVVCGTGRNGSHGSQGQPGPVGHDGYPGNDGTLRFFEFTEESWNEQLTRPWLYEMTPIHVFPGDTINITGTRFADTDRVIIGGISLNPRIEVDESLTVTLPANIDGGEKTLYVRRYDGDESNYLRFWVKPRLDILPTDLAPEMMVTITGRAFMSGAKVLYNGMLTDATFVSKTELTFIVPGTGGVNVAETEITVAVRNPDGEVSNTRNATVARTLDTGIRIGVHDFAFANFKAGDPSWDTFEDTFGAFEVWHEALDPIFGHPVLTAAFYAFYHYFLLGEDNGGLATGFCTSLSTIVLDEYYTGSTDTHTRYVLDDATRERFTAIHGRLLSRESLIDFHDQGRRGNANVATVFRRFEAIMRDGADRESALMLFFVPSGAAWDEGYFDMLGGTHCIVPIRIVYPIGHDGTSIDGVTMQCWDCNHPVEEGAEDAHNCRIVFRLTDGEIRYDYFDGIGTTPKFCSEDGITLASMSNGKYLLSDHDMPFSGPFGLTRFVLDFLLSPADLLVEDGSARRTGRHGGNIVAEIPDSHPAYLAKNLYLLPADTGLTRRITGNGSGSYSYHSIAPNGTSLSLENVATSVGEEDVLAVNADSSQIRFTPGASKTFRFNLAREIGDEVRAISVEGGSASPLAEMDMTVSPDLSVVRMGNREVARNVDVRVSVYQKSSGANTTLDRNSITLPADHDLVVTVTDWADLALTVRSLPFSV